MQRGEVKEKSTPTDSVIYFNYLSPSVPIYAPPCVICPDPSLSSFSLTTHRYSYIQQRWADLSLVSSTLLMVAFIFQLMKVLQ